MTLAQKHRDESGFTLIEIMAVVVVVAILASVALPAFQDAIRKSRRTDATAALSMAQIEQEKFRNSCPHYAPGIANARVCDRSTPANSRLVTATESPDGYYAISVVSATADDYTLRASGQNGQQNDNSGDDCRVIDVDRAGDYSPAACINK
jgi:type IV pilus assembly protein PilE